MASLGELCGATVFITVPGVTWSLCTLVPLVLAELVAGRQAGRRPSGAGKLSDLRLLASCLKPKLVPFLLARPEVALRAPRAVGGAAQGHLGWARVRAADAPSTPGPRLGVGCGLGWGVAQGVPCLLGQAEAPQLVCGFRTCPAPSLMFCPPPLVRLGEPRTDQAHGERLGPTPHTCTCVLT